MPEGSQYFVEHKRGEINELKTLLRKTRNDKELREVVKKVIAYMTLGIDVSKLFSDVIMVCSSPL